MVVGILLLGGHLNNIALGQPEPMQTILTVVYFCIPHFEWFYLSDFVVYNKAVPSWWKVFEATFYASAWTGFFLVLAWAGFRRKNLTT